MRPPYRAQRQRPSPARSPVARDDICSNSPTRSRVAAILLAAWGALLLLGCITGSLISDAHPGFDASVADALRGPRTGALTTIMRTVTWLGSGPWLDVVFAAGLGTLLLRRRRRAAVFLILASPGTVLMVQIIKAAVGRSRPLGAHLTPATGPSWPSGHASSSAALYGALLLIALGSGVLRGKRARRGAGLLCVGLLAMIGLSRVYLGVHYPTDVLGAWLLVTGWLTVLERTVGVGRDRSPEPAELPERPGGKSPWCRESEIREQS